MKNCFKCGVEENRAYLFEGISNEGFVNICKNCLKEEDIPLVNKPSSDRLNDSDRRLGSYERLSNMSKINSKEHQDKFSRLSKEKIEAMERQDISLREIVERNTENKFKPEEVSVDLKNLVDNFHWIIMRARRNKKMTRDQLAREIGESSMAVRRVEEGSLPGDYTKLIRKFEGYFGIKLFSENYYEPEEVEFDPVSKKTLTLADLLRLKRMQGTKSPTSSSKNRERKEEYVEPEKPEEVLGDEFVGEDMAPEGVPQGGASTSSRPRDISEEMSTRGNYSLFEEERFLSDEEVDDVIYGKK
jgi:ribosome-binding protein aMBF1 (putative translation factor)